MKKHGKLETLRCKLREDAVLFARLILNFNPFHYQAKLLKDRSKRIVACFGRQTGKTTIIAAKAVHFAYTNPKVTVLIVSPSLRQSMIMFQRVCDFAHTNKFMAECVKRKTRTSLELSNGSKIIALPCALHRLRGFTAHMVIVDEAAFVPEETIGEVLNPMLAATDGALILVSTPWGRNHFYKAFIDPAFTVHKAKSSECPLISEDFLRKQREYMTVEAYKREYEAEFVEEAQCYFPQDLIHNCVEPELQLYTENVILEKVRASKGDFYLGVDLGKLRDYSAVAVIDKKQDETLRLVFLKEFPLGTQYSQVLGWIIKANENFLFKKILIDQSGVGEPFLEELKNLKLSKASGVKLTLQTKMEILSYLRLKMEQSKLKMPYLRPLFQQLNQQKYEYTKTGQLKFWHPPNTHDDQLWALALAVYATKTLAPEGRIIKAW